MLILNNETAKNYKKRVFKEMQYSGHAFKIYCMVKIFGLCSGFLGKKSVI